MAKPPKKPRCPVCRTRRATFTGLLAHQKTHDHKAACQCGGYHYPHRDFSPYCHKNPLSSVRAAVREGALSDEALQDAIEEIAFNGPGRPMPVWPL